MAVIPAYSAEQGLRDSAAAEAQLIEIRQQIGELEDEIQRAASNRGAAEQALSVAERDESKVRQSLREIDAELKAVGTRLLQLEADVAAATGRMTGFVEELESQLRLAYVAGREDWLRSVLSQRDPVEIGRQLVYRSYFAQQRNALIDAVQAELGVLSAATEQIEAERASLLTLEGRERERINALAEARGQRERALADIDAKIESRGQRVERLRTEAADLENLVAELTRLLANLPIDSETAFAQRKGRMDWPVAGQVVRKFGQSRADGRMTWDGVLLAAPAGGEVRAVHHGRVAFADWLPGMGLLVIVDHGDGYLSLYGHNQDLSTGVGEWVDPGSVIAYVGDSGGQALTGLYFELRKSGKPLNPAPWIAP